MEHHSITISMCELLSIRSFSEYDTRDQFLSHHGHRTCLLKFCLHVTTARTVTELLTTNLICNYRSRCCNATENRGASYNRVWAFIEQLSMGTLNRCNYEAISVQQLFKLIKSLITHLLITKRLMLKKLCIRDQPFNPHAALRS